MDGIKELIDLIVDQIESLEQQKADPERIRARREILEFLNKELEIYNGKTN